ncbi:MAG: zinc ribbon domain-containing protein [Thermoanaerobaculia bacterium]
MLWSASRRKLRCDYCGYEQAAGSPAGAVNAATAASTADAANLVELAPPAAAVAELPLADRLAEVTDLGWGAERRTVQCSKCGAAESFEPGIAARACAFCGSSAVVEAPEGRNAVRPDGVLPFRLERNEAVRRFRAWLRSLWFRPNRLKERAALTAIQGIYLPFWTFDAESHADWTAEAGYRRGTGKDARIDWKPVSGAIDHRFDDVPVPASRGLDGATAREIEPFPTAELAPYDPGYLSGFLAEEFAVGVEEAHGRVRQRMDDTLREACRHEVPGDECRNLRVVTSYRDWTTKSGLLPIWIAAYEYEGKSFRYVVNGATGKATGTAPWSWIKIGLAVLAIATLLLFFLSH